MPKRRPPKIINRKTVSEEEVERFANQSDDTIGIQRSLDPDAIPRIGLNIRFNDYEHQYLKNLARKEGRSLQKQIKMIIRAAIGV